MLEKHYLTYLHGEFILDMKQLFFFFFRSVVAICFVTY